MSERRYWLFKSEPDVYGLDQLKADGQTEWDGIRNYQARNFLRDDTRVGDLVLYYHSNTKPPGVVGLARVATEPYADPSQFDTESKYHDPKATEEEPRWILVDVAYVDHFADTVTLEQLKAEDDLDGMLVTRKGQRLSVQPVEPHHFERVCEMAGYDLGSLD